MSVRGCEQFTTSIRVLPVLGADGVNDETSVQVSSRRRNRRTRRQAMGIEATSYVFARLEKRRAGCRMNRTIHPTPTHQRGVGGIDDGVDVLSSYVTSSNVDHRLHSQHSPEKSASGDRLDPRPDIEEENQRDYCPGDAEEAESEIGNQPRQQA